MDVLVVDDAVAVRSRICALLREAGLAICGEVGSVAETLAFVATRTPDGIVLDLQLPDGSGLDLLPRLRACAPAAVLVVLTNATRAGYRERCVALGASFVFDKSTQFDRVAPALLAPDQPQV